MSEPQVPPAPEPGGATAPPTPPAAGYTPPPVAGYASPPTGTPGYAAPPPGPVVGAPVTESDEKTWATLAHAGGILIGFLAGLIVYLIYKDRSRYLKEQGAEALNFQITMAIGYVVSGILVTVLVGFFTYAAVAIVQLVFGIIAALAASRHEDYRYPFAIRLIK